MADGPSFCWHCMRDLVRNHTGVIFAAVRDPLGNVHRVHKQDQCLQDSIADGNVEVDPATWQVKKELQP